jgi:hypothetical protein
MLTIVIGDIHGMAAKLENLLGQIDMWCAANARAGFCRKFSLWARKARDDAFVYPASA